MASALPSITGVYDVALGVRPSDVEDVITHYQQFGFGAPSREGRLSADEAHTLYGHRAALRAVRLPHQDSDHGLLVCLPPSTLPTFTASPHTREWTNWPRIRYPLSASAAAGQRLLIWEHPKNAGVGAGPLKAAGSRWAIALVADVWNIAHHARAAQTAAGVVRDEFDAARGMRKTWSDGMYCVMPLDGMIYSLPPGAPEALPFVDRMPHVSEMLLSRDTTGKQVLFARMDYEIPEYGKINWDAHFPCSQFAHVGLVVDGEDPSVLDFYEDTLGLMRTGSKEVAPTLLQEALMDFTPGTSVIRYDR
jgi:hypothetical protein